MFDNVIFFVVVRIISFSMMICVVLKCVIRWLVKNEGVNIVSICSDMMLVVFEV